MNPIRTPIDYIILSGKRSPGIADLPTGGESPQKWDERAGYGVSGAFLVFTGDGLAAFTVKIRLYTAEDFDAWTSFQPLVAAPPRGKRPKAKDIWHPFLEAHDIRSVVVENWKGPTQTADGEWTIEIDFKQWRGAPKPALAKPLGSEAAPRPESDKEKTVRALAGQVQELAK